MAFFWKRKQKEMEILPPPQKPRISIPSDLPSFPSSREDKLPLLPPLEKKPEPPLFREEAEGLPPLPKFEPLPPLPPLPSLEPETEIKTAVRGVRDINEQAPIPRPVQKPIPNFSQPAFSPWDLPKPVIRQMPERIFPKKEALKLKEEKEKIKTLKRGLLRGKELFIEVEDYRIISGMLANSKTRVSNLLSSIERAEGFYEGEEEALEKWQSGLEFVQKRLIAIDKGLFRRGG